MPRGKALFKLVVKRVRGSKKGTTYSRSFKSQADMNAYKTRIAKRGKPKISQEKKLTEQIRKGNIEARARAKRLGADKPLKPADPKRLEQIREGRAKYDAALKGDKSLAAAFKKKTAIEKASFGKSADEMKALNRRIAALKKIPKRVLKTKKGGVQARDRKLRALVKGKDNIFAKHSRERDRAHNAFNALEKKVLRKRGFKGRSPLTGQDIGR